MKRSTKRGIVWLALAGGAAAGLGWVMGWFKPSAAKAVQAAYYQAVGTEAMALASSYDYTPPPVRDPSEYDLVVPA